MKIYISQGVVGIYCPVIDAAEHRHHALQLILSLNSPFSLKTDGSSLSCRAAAVAPNTPHHLAATDIISFLLEPESPLAMDFRKRWMPKHLIADLGDGMAKKAYGIFQGLSLTRESLADFFSAQTPISRIQRHFDYRILRVLAWIDATMASGRCADVTLQGALDVAFLSKSRFLHLFSEQLGIPWRRYLLWRRLLAVFRYAAKGHSLTDCAHFAAFSDSAHFSRTFKSMFGTPPTTMIKNSRFIQVF